MITGYSLFKHAVTRVFRNLDDALAISGLIWIGVMGILVLISVAVPTPPVTNQNWADLTGRELMAFLMSNLTVMIAGVWVAVEWHRFVLLGERPKTVLPVPRLDLIAGYMGRSIQIFAILFLVMFVAATLVALLARVSVVFAMLYFPVFIMLLQIFYRISPVLPAVAVSKPASLRSVWQATDAYKKPILGAAILLALGTMALNLPSFLLGQGVIALVYSLVTGWIALMVGVSLLSAIYEISVPEDDV